MILNLLHSTGHFTQLVWKESKEHCIALAKTEDGNTVYVAANYFPPGNFVGKYKENVPNLVDAKDASGSGAPKTTSHISTFGYVMTLFVLRTYAF